MSVRTTFVLVVVALALRAGPAPAQENPALQEAVRLAAEGRGEDARRMVGAALARARPGEPAYVEALFFRARLTAIGDSAERDLRRIAIEYPTSRWADDALLQLAQLAMAAGNPVSAFALAERLRSDYPDSDLRPRAAFWAGRAAFDLGDARVGCALLDTARSEAAADIEFANQVGFYRGRCGAPAVAAPPVAQGNQPPVPVTQPPAPVQALPAPVAPSRSDTARPVVAPADRAPQRPGGQPPAVRQPAPAAVPDSLRRAGDYTVQVAAVKTDAEERRVLQLLQRAGYDGHVVAGTNDFRRIRVGAYATEREAQRAVAALRRVVGGQPFVVRER